MYLSSSTPEITPKNNQSSHKTSDDTHQTTAVSKNRISSKPVPRNQIIEANIFETEKEQQQY